MNLISFSKFSYLKQVFYLPSQYCLKTWKKAVTWAKG